MFSNIKNFHYIFFLSILLLVTTYAFLHTIGTDTSWIINKIDQYKITGNFIDITPSGTAGNWDNIFILINSHMSILFNEINIGYWLFNFIYSLIGFYIFYMLLREISKEITNIYFGVMSYVLLVYFSGIFMGSRPENIYISSIVIVLFLINRFIKYQKYITIYFASLFSVLGALSHPNGFILFVILFIFALKLIILKKFNLLHLIFNILLISITLYYGLFFGQTYCEFINMFQNISNDTNHSLPFYYEPKRYMSFVFKHVLVAPLFLFGIFTLFLYIKKYFFNFRDYFFKNLVAVIAFFVVLYLTFIGVKWEYYLSLLFTFIVFSILEYIKDKNFNKNLFIGVGYIIMIVTIIRDFKKNEEFLKLLNIPSQRVNIISEVRSMIKDSKVYAPMRLYIMHKYYNKFIPLEKSDIQNTDIDFMILDFDKPKEIYEKNFNIKSEFIRSFVFNDHHYNLFKINDAK